MTIQASSGEIDLHLPFSGIPGNEDLKLALILGLISPQIGGVLVRGVSGTGKTITVNSIQSILPEDTFVEGCLQNCDPTRPEDFCMDCKNKRDSINPIQRKIPFVRLPNSATEEVLTGSLNVEASLKDRTPRYQPGLLVRANRGILFLDNVNLIPQHLLDGMLEATSAGLHHVESKGVSRSHLSSFFLIGCLNPSEGELRPQISDRFGLCIDLITDFDAQERIVRLKTYLLLDQRSEKLLEFCNKRDTELQEQVTKARNLLKKGVVVPDQIKTSVAQLCSSLNVDGARPSLTIIRASRALAAFEGRNSVSDMDIAVVSPLVLAHRSRKGGDLSPATTEEILETLTNVVLLDQEDPVQTKKDLSIVKEKGQKKESMVPTKREKVFSMIKTYDKVGRVIFGLIFPISLVILALMRTSTSPSIIIDVLIILLVAGLFFYGFSKYFPKKVDSEVMKRQEEQLQEKLEQDQYKEFKLSETPEEESGKASFLPGLEPRKKKSRRRRVLSAFGIGRQGSLISLSSTQMKILNIIGIPLVMIGFITIVYVIIILPPEFFVFLAIFIAVLTGFGLISNRDPGKRRMRRMAETPTSAHEKSKEGGELNLGSYISDKPTKAQYSKSPFSSEGFQKNWEALTSRLNVSQFWKTDGRIFEEGMPIVPSNVGSSLGKVFKPQKMGVKSGKADRTVRSAPGKRAMSLTSLNRGRVVGWRVPKSTNPQSIHLPATLRAAIRRQTARWTPTADESEQLRISSQDIREKQRMYRAPSLLVLVIDLSQSIFHIVDWIRDSIVSLQEEAYRYRDQIALVALKGREARIIQEPTSNFKQVLSKLKSLRVSSSTPLPAGLHKAMEIIRFERRRNSDLIPIIVLFSDGGTNIPLPMDPATNEARDLALPGFYLEHSIQLSILDCLGLCRRLDKMKTRLVAFTPWTQYSTASKISPREAEGYLLQLIGGVGDSLSNKRILPLWSSLLLKSMVHITKGELFEIGYDLKSARRGMIYTATMANPQPIQHP